MDLNWIYYFHTGEIGDKVLSELEVIRESGDHIGFTYSKHRTHQCFFQLHVEKLEQVIAKYPDLQFESCSYFDGNVMDEDFGISTFRQPLVQWCPPVIITKFDRIVIDAEDSWGLSTDGLVALCSELSAVVDTGIVGLTRLEENVAGPFELYRINNDDVEIPHKIIAEAPLQVKGHGLPQADIFRLENGIILLSQAFAKILKKYWDGDMYAKFGPVMAEAIAPKLKKFLCRRIKSASKIDKSMLEGIQEIENHIGFKFPSDYVQWLIGRPNGILPLGWLSPNGGLNYEIS